MKYSYIFIIAISTILLTGCASSNNSTNVSNTIAYANKGNAAAQNNLGSMYQYGDGVSLDYKESIKWYKKSAEQGLPMAKVNLGYMYDGGLGVTVNKEKAISLYQEAANEGEPRGMINLGEMYRLGDNITQSNVKAFMWLNIARFYTQFSKDRQAKWASRGALDKLKENMSLQEIEEGKRLSKNWIDSNK